EEREEVSGFMEPKALSVVDHLGELRRRLWISVIVFVLASVFSYPLASYIIQIMKEDLMGGVTLVILSPLEAVSVKVKISLLVGFILSLPVLAYEFWSFLSPGLKAGERRFLAVSLLPSILLFLTGVLFAYRVLLPTAIRLMLDEAYPVAVPMLSLGETFSFVLFVLFSTGVSFQLPLVVVALSRIGILDYRMLSSTRKYAIVGIFIFAAAVTPDPTMVSQMLVAVPMLLLYEVSIQLSRLVS
ncbi:MAG: twin-arginine translocase subunit TatC, partial [Candidatus Altiarchaeota archaeon]